MATLEIDETDWVSRSRLKCVQGHTDWRAREGYFHCISCEKRGKGPDYDVLVDGKTGQFVARDEVEVTAGR